jgi:hypothetical protein
MKDWLPKDMKQWIMSVATLFVAGTPGAIEVCQEIINPPAWVVSVCGRDLSVQEQINMKLGPEKLMATPVTTMEFEINADVHIRAQAYDDGVVAIRQTVHDQKAPGGYRQQLLFLTPDPWEEVLQEARLRVPTWPALAYADLIQVNAPPPLNIPYTDVVLKKSSDGYRVLIQRTYVNGCVDVFWMDLAYGSIDWASLERSCP